MKKRLLAFLIALVVLLANAIPAFAATNVIGMDFSTEENQTIDELSKAIYDAYGIEAFVVFDTSVSGNDATVELAKKTFKDKAKGNDGICLAYTSDMYYLYKSGSAIDVLPEDFDESLWSYATAYGDSYYNFTAACYSYITTTLSSNYLDTSAETPSLISSAPESDDVDIAPAPDVTSGLSYMGKYVVDEAGLLYNSDAEKLEQKLQEISTRQKFDVVVVTVNTLDGKTPEAYADDYFDYNGYGQGDNHDGCLLLVSMEDRDWHLSTTGYGITALTDAGIKYISDSFLPSLSDGDYDAAFNTYADLVDQFVTQAKTDKPYDVGNMPKHQKKFEAKFILYGLIAGLVVALIVVGTLKAQLKSVAHKAEANEYLVDGSLVITNQSDTFITTHVSKTRREKDSGGSSTHTGSSGTSHGGGGGKF